MHRWNWVFILMNIRTHSRIKIRVHLQIIIIKNKYPNNKIDPFEYMSTCSHYIVHIYLRSRWSVFSFHGWGGGGGGRSNWKYLGKGIKSTAETNFDIISDLISFRVASPVTVNCTDVVLESQLNLLETLMPRVNSQLN